MPTTRVLALERALVATTLPRAGQRLKRGEVPLAVIALAALKRRENLLGDRRGEHVQHLVALIAGVVLTGVVVAAGVLVDVEDVPVGTVTAPTVQL